MIPSSSGGRSRPMNDSMTSVADIPGDADDDLSGISPELVLVDPELARLMRERERALLTAPPKRTPTLRLVPAATALVPRPAAPAPPTVDEPSAPAAPAPAGAPESAPAARAAAPEPSPPLAPIEPGDGRPSEPESPLPVAPAPAAAPAAPGIDRRPEPSAPAEPPAPPASPPAPTLERVLEAEPVWIVEPTQGAPAERAELPSASPAAIQHAMPHTLTRPATVPRQVRAPRAPRRGRGALALLTAIAVASLAVFGIMQWSGGLPVGSSGSNDATAVVPGTPPTVPAKKAAHAQTKAGAPAKPPAKARATKPKKTSTGAKTSPSGVAKARAAAEARAEAKAKAARARAAARAKAAARARASGQGEGGQSEGGHLDEDDVGCAGQVQGEGCGGRRRGTRRSGNPALRVGTCRRRDRLPGRALQGREPRAREGDDGARARDRAELAVRGPDEPPDVRLVQVVRLADHQERSLDPGRRPGHTRRPVAHQLHGDRSVEGVKRRRACADEVRDDPCGTRGRRSRRRSSEDQPRARPRRPRALSAGAPARPDPLPPSATASASVAQPPSDAGRAVAVRACDAGRFVAVRRRGSGPGRAQRRSPRPARSGGRSRPRSRRRCAARARGAPGTPAPM